MNRWSLSIRALGAAAGVLLAARGSYAQGLPPFVFHAEVGGGAILTAPQQRQLGLTGVFEGTLRAGVRVHPSVSVRLSGSYWGYPARAGGNAVAMYGVGSLQAGVRIDPAFQTLGRLWLDLDFGAGFTGADELHMRAAGGVGVGFDFRITPTLAIGPFTRVEVVVPLPTTDQFAAPITLVAGVGFTLEPRVRAPAPPPPLPTPPATPTPPADSDHDGVIDPEDRCPQEPAGAQPDPARAGCPMGDADGDGVLPPTDRCPDQPETRNGFEDEDGCPDNPDADGDGVALPADRCPDQPETRNGFEDTDGCPDTTAPAPVQVVGERITVNGTINFQPDRDRILRDSFGLLDGVVAVLQAHPEILRIRIEGHTDDQGNPRRNRTLSRSRARAVERYFRDHGVDRGRLTSEGFGADRPLATGNTPEDQARNRRVEFYIVDPPPGAPAGTAASPAAPTPTPTPTPTPSDEGRSDHHGRHGRHGRDGSRGHH